MMMRKTVMSLVILVLLLQLGVLGCASQKGRQHSSTASIREARSGEIGINDSRKVFITGSMIPQPVDKDGRPTESTTAVQIIDQKSINLVGGGSPIEALGKLPYASRTPR